MRTTESEVGEIMGQQSFNLDPFIVTANQIIEAKGITNNLSDETLTEIEKYLAAHIATVRAPLMSRQSISDASEEYIRAGGDKGLSATDFGQVVLNLDVTGTFADSDKSGAEIQSYDVLTTDL